MEKRLNLMPQSSPPLESVYTWKFCPLTNTQVAAVTATLICYSLVYLIYAQHHSVLFYFMTGLIASFMVFLYTSGLLAVIYMMIVVVKLDGEVKMRHPSTPTKHDLEATIVEMKF
ncbi:unnamed protein product [Toxocara canis]|nr:unnamed protein product [Toxocara canis]